ncbi:MAG: hypothetical protein Hyperionvirus2_12 [Hyperionvirus sp.]|uniref:Uncharacterized protein n=1 Tax=Hyperionvirus sp. TaxID=2487770 RepID=A0A3G5A800_9VIRU|nr:MAG: hypothetical protein Hyperionvirus2_12 [Hyperionvirus sp.]
MNKYVYLIAGLVLFVVFLCCLSCFVRDIVGVSIACPVVIMVVVCGYFFVSRDCGD